MLAMGPRDLNSAPNSPVHCSSHSMTSFQSSELTELPVVENSQLFAQRTVRPQIHANYAIRPGATRGYIRVGSACLTTSGLSSLEGDRAQHSGTRRRNTAAGGCEVIAGAGPLWGPRVGARGVPQAHTQCQADRRCVVRMRAMIRTWVWHVTWPDIPAKGRDVPGTGQGTPHMPGHRKGCGGGQYTGMQ